MKTRSKTIDEMFKILQQVGVFNDYPFGVCYCGSSGKMYNIGRENWLCCDNCKTKWIIGNNLFGGWRSENEELWEENFRQHADYEEISNEESLLNVSLILIRSSRVKAL